MNQLYNKNIVLGMKRIYDEINKYVDISYERNMNKVINMYLENKISREGLRYYLTKSLILSEEKIDKIMDSIKDISYIEKDIHRNDEPLISIIITTYNRKQYLQEAIDSVLKQDYKNIEIVIMDDCSTDGTEKIIKQKYSDKKNVVYIKNEKNMGPGVNRLKAFKEIITGEYVVFMDDDDFYIDYSYIKKAIDIHLSKTDISFVAADVFVENCNSGKVSLVNLEGNGIINNKVYFSNFQGKEYPKPASTFTAVFKKSLLINTDIDEMKIFNDSTIYLRALLGGDCFLLNNIVGIYRIHGNNITFSCNSDFIIENLNEKLSIGIRAKKNFDYNDKELNIWMYEQLYITIFYYFGNSRVGINDYIKILKWVKNNSKENYVVIRNSLIKQLLRKVI